MTPDFSLFNRKRSIKVQFVQETPGGYICDVDVKNLRASTNHRIVVRLDLKVGGDYRESR